MRLCIATCVAEKDLPRFSILRLTISKFWPDVTHLVIAENEEVYHACYDYPNTEVTIQDCLLDTSKLWSNWHRQQVLKLELTSKLEDSYDYIIWLDCDTFLIRPVNEYELTTNGKPRIQWDKIWCQHWIDAVQLVLGIKLKHQPQVVAPFLSPGLTRQLLDYIEDRHKCSWLSYLIGLSNNKVLWTEYALYFAYVAKLEQRLGSKFYHDVSTNSLTGASYNLSLPTSFESSDMPTKWARGGTFAVVESNTKTDPALILETVHEWMLSGLWEEKVLLPVS